MPFAVPMLLGFLALNGAPDLERAPWLLLLALLLMLAIAGSLFLVPWRRFPREMESIPPLLYILIVFLLREGAGGPYEVYAPLLLLPLFWLALHGSRRELVMGLVLVILLGLLSNLLHGASTETLRFQFLALLVYPTVCFTAQSFVWRMHTQATQLQTMALTDRLTSLPNRRAWEEELPRALSRAQRYDATVCVALFDLDHFRAFNEAYGQEKGDQLLQSTAATWLRMIRKHDFLARFGGEEFALLLPTHSSADALSVVERLREALPPGQSCSAGVACWDGIESPASLMARADTALYMAKQAGRDQSVLTYQP